MNLRVTIFDICCAEILMCLQLGQRRSAHDIKCIHIHVSPVYNEIQSILQLIGQTIYNYGLGLILNLFEQLVHSPLYKNKLKTYNEL